MREINYDPGGWWDDDHPREECAVVAISSAEGAPLPILVYNSLLEQQHRGQDAAGLAYEHQGKLEVRKGVGLVTEALTGYKIQRIEHLTHLAVGHVRYGTSEISTGTDSKQLSKKQKYKRDLRAAHPIKAGQAEHSLALVKNGQINNIDTLVEQKGRELAEFVTDSDALAWYLQHDYQHSGDLEETMKKLLPRCIGSFCLAVLTNNRIVAARDGHGFRPLSLGKRSDGYAVTSESSALRSAGASLVRDIAPGEMVTLQADKLFSQALTEAKSKHLCLMEKIYAARPDSIIDGKEIASDRQEMGRRLALVQPVEADVVIGTPDSGVIAADGYAEISKIPRAKGFVKNSYVGRTFIAKGQQNREEKVRLKLSPIKAHVEKKRVVVVDDSIVRGTTFRALVNMLREAGAREVHGRISSPPIKWPCFYAMDFSDRKQLIAAMHDSVEAIRCETGLDSLAYLPLQDTLESTLTYTEKESDDHEHGYCTACFTGEYPTDLTPLMIKRINEAPAP